MRNIGVISDTHLTEVTDLFERQVHHAFEGCDTIIHAGDLIDLAVLDVFKGRQVHAVYGNCCNKATQKSLPRYISLRVDTYTVSVCHGDCNGMEIEDRLLQLFPEADCIIYGHTHTAERKQIGSLLLVNPGSFHGTGRYGAAGTYARLSIGERGIVATIHQLPPDI